MLTSVSVCIWLFLCFNYGMLINSLQTLLATSEEKIRVMEKWTTVEQQRQDAEKQILELQVCRCVCVCVCVCVRARVRACARACVRACVCVCACMPACLPACLCLSACLSVCLTDLLIDWLCLSVCLSVCLSSYACTFMYACVNI